MHLGHLLVGVVGILAVIALDKTLGITTKVVSAVGVTPK